MGALSDFQTSLTEMEVDQPWASGDPFSLGQPQRGIFDDVPEFVGDPALDEKPELKPNQNAAQAWKQNPGNMGGVAQVQQQNRELLKPKSDSTSRYYTRQLYRELLKSRDPETRMQARLGLRIRGADPNAGMDQMVSSRTPQGQKIETWEDTFPTRPGQKPNPEGIRGTAGMPEQAWRKLFPEAEKRNLPSPAVDPDKGIEMNAERAEEWLDQIINRTA